MLQQPCSSIDYFYLKQALPMANRYLLQGYGRLKAFLHETKHGLRGFLESKLDIGK